MGLGFSLEWKEAPDEEHGAQGSEDNANGHGIKLQRAGLRQELQVKDAVLAPDNDSHREDEAHVIKIRYAAQREEKKDIVERQENDPARKDAEREALGGLFLVGLV